MVWESRGVHCCRRVWVRNGLLRIQDHDVDGYDDIDIDDDGGGGDFDCYCNGGDDDIELDGCEL